MSSDPEKQPEFSQMFLRMTEVWRTAIEKSEEAGKAWTESTMPFLTERATDAGMFNATQGGEISAAIKRMVEGPRLADVWDLDRQMLALTAAWTEIRQRMATYQAIASIPWNRTFERYGAVLADKKDGDDDGNWRKAFSAWSAIANEELIKNQRSEEFLNAQRDLLRSALALKTQQQAITDSAAKLFGLPTQQDFDEVTRQLTELRRKLRAHLRSQRDNAAAPEAAPAKPGATGKSSKAKS